MSTMNLYLQVLSIATPTPLACAPSCSQSLVLSRSGTASKGTNDINILDRCSVIRIHQIEDAATIAEFGCICFCRILECLNLRPTRRPSIW
ncbi:hypothetical protein FB45DRAFT_326476 [Roridomyces roridus]|uniref:Uncharacterized protein n=1 Tax=Roridomyces roridus TaxID=1738132 RepID=A0AAD7B5X0_9AGAR|nr:hypothetical protein FB45DRAFT_326476 [Roridomyces roridus]